MSRLFLIVIPGAMILAGCSKGPPVVSNAVGTERGTQTAAPPDIPPPPMEPEKNLKEEAARSAELLAHEDPNVRAEGSRQLKEIGEPAYPHILRAIGDKAAQVRRAGIEGIGPVVMAAHQKELVPMLLNLLSKDSDPLTRQQACMALTLADQVLPDGEVLAGFLARERLDALKVAAEKDKDIGVQDTARLASEIVHQAIQGKVADATVGAAKPPDFQPGTRPMPKRELPRPK